MTFRQFEGPRPMTSAQPSEAGEHRCLLPSEVRQVPAIVPEFRHAKKLTAAYAPWFLHTPAIQMAASEVAMLRPSQPHRILPESVTLSGAVPAMGQRGHNLARYRKKSAAEANSLGERPEALTNPQPQAVHARDRFNRRSTMAFMNIAAALIVVVASCAAQPLFRHTETGQGSVVRADANLVLVPVTVTDDRGARCRI